MRKFYQDYSLIGVVLIIAVFGLGLTFRLFNIEAISAWGDEVASLYYAKHLERVFLYESHTPFYYLICKAWMWVFPDSIISLRYLFVSLSALLMSCCCYLLVKRRGSGSAFVFLVLWWLWPTDVTFSRQARHYSLYAEMTFLLLILWDYRKEYSRKFLYTIWSIYQLIHPFALISVWYLALYDWARGRAKKKEILFYLSSSLPLFSYYAIRFSLYGSERVFSNISWVNENWSDFLKSLYLLFVGDSFPLNQIYPLSLWVGTSFLLLVLACFLANKDCLKNFFLKDKMLKFLQLYLITVIFAEIFSYLFTNIKIGRYFIYLIPFFLYALIDFVNEFKTAFNLKLCLVLSFILVTYNVAVFIPWRTYEWDDQNVAEFKSYYSNLAPKELVICANAFQMDYYFKKSYETCTDVALRFHLRKESFHLFSLTGTDKLLMLFLMKEGHIDDYKLFNQAVFISVSYPKSKK